MRVRRAAAQVFPDDPSLTEVFFFFFNQAPLHCKMKSLCLLACDLDQSSTVSVCFQLFTKRSSSPIDLSWLSGWGSTFCKNDDLFLDSHFPSSDLCLHADTGCCLLLFCGKFLDQCFPSKQPACPVLCSSTWSILPWHYRKNSAGFFFFTWDGVTLCNPCCFFTQSNSPAFASQILGLQAYATMTRQPGMFVCKYDIETVAFPISIVFLLLICQHEMYFIYVLFNSFWW